MAAEPDPNPDSDSDSELDPDLMAGLGSSPAELAAWLRVGLGDWGLPEEVIEVPPDAPEDLKRMARYRIIRKLGEGGFGEVWAARQLEPVKRDVALKVLKPGMDTRQIVARFEQERQAQAMMVHAGIAAIYDGGETPSGRSFFAMEMVDGPSLTRYCDEKKLSVRQRLELFIEICLPVHHAHLKRALHRDLKPSNILVAEQDGVPRPKVIDFGISKILGDIDSERSDLFTGWGAVMGTLSYMSPEQASGGVQDLDTRTDIYSLGVILYELLTGRTPLYPGKEKPNWSRQEILRRIAEEAPPRPSQLVEALTPEELSERSTSSARALQRQIEGDLDWILLKALAKDREKRYDSATAFADDIRRHLSHLPVSARRPSRAEACLKFAKRNRVVAASVMLSFCVLAVSTFASYAAFVREGRSRLQAEANAFEAQRQAKKAEDTLKYLDTLLLRAGSFAAKGANPEALRLALDEVTLQIPAFTEDPDLRETIVGRASMIYREIGDSDKAIPLIKAQLEIAVRKYGPLAPDTLDVMDRYGRALSVKDQHDEAIRISTQVLAGWQQLPQHPEAESNLFRARRHLADILKRAGRVQDALAECETLWTQATEATRKSSGWNRFIRTYVGGLREAGQFDKAGQILQQALAGLGSARGAALHDHSILFQEEARLKRALGDIDGCARSLRLSIEAEEQAFGGASAFLSMLHVELSRPLDLSNLSDEAVDHCRRAVELAIRCDDRPQALAATRALAENLENAGRFAEAATEWREAAKRQSGLANPLHQQLMDLAFAARALARAGATEDAAKLAESVHSHWAEISRDLDATYSRRLIRTALAYVAAVESSVSGRPLPPDWRLTLYQLSEADLRDLESQPVEGVPADLFARLRGGRGRDGVLLPPDAVALLAYDQAISDRWNDFESSGTLFHLAACLRLQNRPDLALELYQSIANRPPESFRVASRPTLARLYQAACLIHVSRAAEANAIIEQVEADLERDARIIPTPLALELIQSLRSQLSLVAQKDRAG